MPAMHPMMPWRIRWAAARPKDCPACRAIGRVCFGGGAAAVGAGRIDRQSRSVHRQPQCRADRADIWRCGGQSLYGAHCAPLAAGKNRRSPRADGKGRPWSRSRHDRRYPSHAVGSFRRGADQEGVSFDLVESSFYTSVPFPADALLWLPSFDAAPAPPAPFDITPIRVHRFETPKANLPGSL